MEVTRVREGPLDELVRRVTAGAGAPPGACIGVATRQALAWAAAGWAQVFDDRGPLADPPAMDLDTQTDVGSVTKVVATTTAVAVLVDAGALRLDDALRRLVPEAPRPLGDVTVAELLEHRGGLWEWWPLYLQAQRADEALAAALQLPLRYRRGAGRHYSDLGFQILGACVARAAGGDLAAAIGELVLDPLELRATGYGRPRAGQVVAASSTGDAIERRMLRTGEPYPVAGEESDFAGWRHHVLVGEVNDGNAFHAFGGVAGHAGLFSSAADLLRYGLALGASARGDGPLAAEITRRFLRPGSDPAQALGLRQWTSHVGSCRTAVCGHTGFPGVAVAAIPDHAAAMALVTNRLHTTGTPKATEAMFLDALTAAHRSLHGGGRGAVQPDAAAATR